MMALLHLEYTSVVMDPHQLKDIRILEKFLHIPCEVDSKTWGALIYDCLLANLTLETLESQRLISKLVLLIN